MPPTVRSGKSQVPDLHAPITYFFSQFGPNTTTLVYPAEVFLVDVRTTGNGIASGVAKVGAFAGAAVLPALVTTWGLTGNDLDPGGPERGRRAVGLTESGVVILTEATGSGGG